jgi:prophage maintenance system killer protein
LCSDFGAEVIEIHADQIHRYGGQAGVRNWGLLEAALAQPEASFSGQEKRIRHGKVT